MTVSVEEAVELALAWKFHREPLLERCRVVKERYDATWVLPELGNVPGAQLAPLTIADSVDNLALRASSVLPAIQVPQTNPGSAEGVGSVEYADRRRQAYGYAWWHSKLARSQINGFRHLAAYATATTVVIPDHETKCPLIVFRDPLATYPEPRAAEDLRPIRRCAFIYGRSVGELRRQYADVEGIDMLDSCDRAQIWEVLEWVDEDVVMQALMGPRDDLTDLNQMGTVWGPNFSGARPLMLRQWENRAGRCTAYTLDAVSLSSVISAISKVTGAVDWLAKLTQLGMMGAEKSVLPDGYIVSDGEGVPTLIGGTWKDGRTGEMNLVQGAKAVGQLRNEPSQAISQAQERQERNIRVSTGLIPQFGGETYGALRTGKGMDSLLSASVDPRVADLQTQMQDLLTETNFNVAACYQGYWKRHKYTVFSGWRQTPTLVEFTPATHFETDFQVVAYPLLGLDLQQLTLVLGQLLGSEVMSAATFRDLHPWIPSGDDEARRVLHERLEETLRVQIMALASDPAGPIQGTDVATMIRAIDEGDSLATAWDKAQSAAQERQVTAVEQGAPETMPGMALPGTGMEQPALPPGAAGALPPGGGGEPATIPPPDADLENLGMLNLVLQGLQQGPSGA